MVSDRKITVLLLDDCRSDARLTALWLRQSRAIGQVELVTHAEAALALLRGRHLRPESEQPRVVLLDLNLRGTSGFSFLRELKADPALASIPVVVLSASVFPEDRRQAAALQASLFVNKPEDAEEYQQLIELLDEFCDRHFPPHGQRESR
jgi:CheY-like chemotaxis protein